MSYRYVIAIVQAGMLEPLEKRLARLHVTGLTATKVKGYGHYANLFASDWLTEHIKIEIFAEQAQVEAVTAAIEEVAHADVPGMGGIVAVIPVENFFHIRNG
jgi:nitrogen regulatory protein PII